MKGRRKGALSLGKKLVSCISSLALALCMTPAVAFADDGETQAAGGGNSVTLFYDDYADLPEGATGEVSVTAQYPQAGDTEVIARTADGKLRATGIGTATVTVGDQTYTYTVEPAPLSVFLVIGQSNAYGSDGDASLSIACPKGQVYSTAYTYGQKMPDNLRDAFAMQESGSGKVGIDSGLAYQWNKMTGDKVWVINSAESGSSINSWIPENNGNNYVRTTGAISKAKTLLVNEANHYTLKNTMYYWLQGETDKAMSSAEYTQKYLSMHNWVTNTSIAADRNIECGGILMVRAAADHLTAKDLAMTGPRISQYYMGQTGGDVYGNIYLASTLGDKWVSDEGVASSFESIYGEGATTVDYVNQAGESPKLLTTVAEAHPTIHYRQTSYNELGRDAAKNMAYILKRAEAPADEAVSVAFTKADGTSTYDVSATDNTVYSGDVIVPIVNPVYKAASNVSCEATGNVGYDGYIASGQTYGSIQVKVGGQEVANGTLSFNGRWADFKWSEDNSSCVASVYDNDVADADNQNINCIITYSDYNTTAKTIVATATCTDSEGQTFSQSKSLSYSGDYLPGIDSTYHFDLTNANGEAGSTLGTTNGNSYHLETGAVKDGVFSNNAYIGLSKSVTLLPNMPWKVGFQITPATSQEFFIFANRLDHRNAGAQYLWYKNGNIIFSAESGSSNQVGLEEPVDVSGKYVTAWNKPADDGTNEVYLTVDGKDYPFNTLYTSGNNQGSRNSLSGKILSFSYIGDASGSFSLKNAKINIDVEECGHVPASEDDITWTWDESDLKCTASYTCDICDKTVSGVATDVTFNPATKVATATFTRLGKTYTGTHTYGADMTCKHDAVASVDPTITWSDDHASCTFALKCPTCGEDFTQTVSGGSIVKTSGFNDKGLGSDVYTATATVNGKQYTASDTVQTEMTLQAKDYTWDFSSANANKEGDVIVSADGSSEPNNLTWQAGSVTSDGTAGTFKGVAKLDENGQVVKDDKGNTVTLKPLLSFERPLRLYASMPWSVTFEGVNMTGMPLTATGDYLTGSYFWFDTRNIGKGNTNRLLVSSQAQTGNQASNVDIPDLSGKTVTVRNVVSGDKNEVRVYASGVEGYWVLDDKFAGGNASNTNTGASYGKTDTLVGNDMILRYFGASTYGMSGSMQKMSVSECTHAPASSTDVKWAWNEDASACTATYTCAFCGQEETVETFVKIDMTNHTATATFEQNGQTFMSDPVECDLECSHDELANAKASAEWASDHSVCTFTVKCPKCGTEFTAEVSGNAIEKTATFDDKGLESATYTASAMIQGYDFSASDTVLVETKIVPKDYTWDFSNVNASKDNNKTVASDSSSSVDNAITLSGGSITNKEFTSVYASLERPIRLCSTLPWSITIEDQDIAANSMLFQSYDLYSKGPYIWVQTKDNVKRLYMSSKYGSDQTSNSSMVDISNKKLRIENAITGEGQNQIRVYVGDSTDYYVLNQKSSSGDISSGTPDNSLSNYDFVMRYLGGADAFKLAGKIGKMTVHECNHERDASAVTVEDGHAMATCKYCGEKFEVSAYADFLGGSLRMDAMDYATTSMRFGYEFTLPEGATLTSWTWRYGKNFAHTATYYAEAAEGQTKGNYVQKGNTYTSNLVFTDIASTNYAKNITVQLSDVTYVLDGATYHISAPTQDTRCVKQVAQGLSASAGVSEAVKAYADGILGAIEQA